MIEDILPKVDSQKAAEDMVEVINYLLEAAAKLTCTVYLRVECIPCMCRRLDDRFVEECFAEHKHLLEKEDDDLNQFMRQVVIWAKDTVEAEMQEPCTMDQAGEILAGIGIVKVDPT